MIDRRACEPCAHLAVIASLFAACSPHSSGMHEDGGPPDAARDAGFTRRDAGTDAGVDAGPCGALTICGAGVCADLTSDPAHCSTCDNACTAPSDATAVCASSACSFVCNPGFVLEGAGCALAPRPLRPPSLSTARTPRPALAWSLPAGLTDATVELCADPDCASVIERIDTTGESAVPSADLPVGPVFWRVTSSARTGPTWRFDVAARAAPIDTAWGTSADYDRDGYDDIAVGAPFAATNDGRVSIFMGAPGGTPAGASAVLRGVAGEAGELGSAVACAGDLDGDGFADLAVGRPQAGAGRVTIFFGSADGIPETGARTIELVSPGDGGSLFGGALAGAGDINGDGFGDLVVAATGEGATPGRIHVYRGQLGGIESAPARTVIGVGRFASAIAGAGDVNGDGYADVVVGAYATASMTGEIDLFLGGTGGIDADPSRTIPGDSPMGQLGFSVCGAGDLDGDGLADVAAGAPNTDSAAGQVVVYYGDPSGLRASSTPIVATSSAGGFFGSSVAGLGDGDADGFDDLAIGAFGVDDRTGRVTVLLGGTGGIGTILRTTVDGPFGSGGDFGWAMMSGDVDDNGRADLVVGSPGADSRNGRAYVFRGAAGGIGVTPLVALLGASGGSFGRTLGGVVP